MTVTKVSINPVDSAKIAVNGTKTLRVWKTQSKGFKAMPHLSGARGDVEYTDHIWTSVPSKADFAAAEGKETVGSLHYMARAVSFASLSCFASEVFSSCGVPCIAPHRKSSLAASTKKGDIYVFNNGEMIQHLADASGDGSSVLCLASRPFGMGIVAGAKTGVVTIYGREVPLQSQTEAEAGGGGASVSAPSSFEPISATGTSKVDKMSLRAMFRYRIEHRLQIKRPFVSRLVGLSTFRLNMEEDEVLAFCFPDNIGTLTIGDANFHLVNPGSRSASPVLGTTTPIPGSLSDAKGGEVLTKEAEDVTFLFGEHGVHFGAVSSMDTIRNKAMLASCSAQDLTVRLWNYKVGLLPLLVLIFLCISGICS